jgi:hypothetical protein
MPEHGMSYYKVLIPKTEGKGTYEWYSFTSGDNTQ